MRAFLTLCLAASVCLAQEAAKLFEKQCAVCHKSGSETRAPIPSALQMLSREKILAALESGSMKAQGSELTKDQRVALASFLTSGVVEAQGRSNDCPAASFSVAPGEAGWSGWGVDAANTRFQSAKA